MLSETCKNTIQRAYRSFLSRRRLKPRYGQRLMIADIARCLGSADPAAQDDPERQPPICAIEAGTGTGKTVAYVLAALPVAQACNKTLVISTATVALQEQLVFKDLPDIQAECELDFSFALAKGRGRYLCLSKLDALLSQQDSGPGTLALYPDEREWQLEAESLVVTSQLLDALNRREWDGDRDNWPQPLDDGLWRRITTDHSQCSGRRCPHVRECCFFRAREQLNDADIIVANHDLVLADLALGGGAVLPAPADAIYVFDEAHHLPDKALNHFAAFARVHGAGQFLEQAEKTLAAVAKQLQASPDILRQIERLPPLFMQARQHLDLLPPLLEPLLEQGAAESRRPGSRLPTYRFANGAVPEGLTDSAAALLDCYQPMADLLGAIGSELERALDTDTHVIDSAVAESCYQAVGLLRARVEGTRDLWRHYARIDDGDPPLVRWLALREGAGGQPDIELNCSPMLAANVLAENLWPHCHGAVLTSATLTALGRFDRLVMRSGLPAHTHFAVVPSPFDYASAATLTVPPAARDGGDPQAHTEALVAALPELLDHREASLVLFSSRRQMEQVHEALSADWQSRILQQDHYNKAELLRLHRGRIDAGEGSVIFGLASFAEGVDLPGAYCRHVLIAKIPFAVPDDPVESALAEWVRARGGNPFMEIAVPDAALKLVQACGRLLRSESDRGRVTLLDRRVVSKRYGRALLDSLPPFRREIN